MNDAFFIAEKRKKKPSRHQIKIELDLPFEVISYLKSLESQSTEGGKMRSLYDLNRKIDLPVRPREQFEVVDGRLLVENNNCYLLADIQKNKIS